MDSEFKIVTKAASAIRSVIKAFQCIRWENPSLNEFLENIESVLAHRRGKIAAVADVYPPAQQVTGLGPKKRRLEFDSDVNACTYSRLNFDIQFTNIGDYDAIAVLPKSRYEKRITLLVNEKSPADQVFAIHLLLENILGNLTTSDLKSCRCVNYSWNSTSVTIFLNRDTFKITCYETSSNTLFGSSVLDETKHYSSLSELLGNSQRNNFTFPCSCFIFMGGNLIHPDFQHFLTNYGSIIKHLQIDINSDPNCDQSSFLKLFRKLLIQDISNVEKLKINKFPKLWNDEHDYGQLFPEPKSCFLLDTSTTTHAVSLVLPKLKSIHFSSCSHVPQKVFIDLITVPPKLEKINLGNESDALITTLLRTNKFYLLGSLEINIDSKNAELFNNLAGHGVQLEKLTFRVHYNDNNDDIIVLDANYGHGHGHGGDGENGEFNNGNLNFKNLVAQVILKFLKSSSGTLVELQTSPLGNFNELSLEFPVMPALKIIRILDDEDPNLKVFPDCLKLSKVFPILVSFESQVDYENENPLEWGAANNGELASIRNMIFSCGPPMSWIEDFSKTFQNLTTLRVGYVENFPAVSKLFWKLHRLEKLAFILDFETESNSYPAIDMGFTGFSKENCFKLYETSRDVDMSTLDALRENPSIIDAKCLKELHMLVFDQSEEIRTGETLPSVSHVTGLFAFLMCPELEVSVSIGAYEERNERSLRNGLSPILPYVDSHLDA